MIASREMAANPASVWESRKTEGAVVVTKNGQPEGVFVATSKETWLEDVQDVLFVKARRATQQMRMNATKEGVKNLSMKEIDAEIKAVRKSRKR